MSTNKLNDFMLHSAKKPYKKVIRDDEGEGIPRGEARVFIGKRRNFISLNRNNRIYSSGSFDRLTSNRELEGVSIHPKVRYYYYPSKPTLLNPNSELARHVHRRHALMFELKLLRSKTERSQGEHNDKP